MNDGYIMDNRFLKGVYQREDIYSQQGHGGYTPSVAILFIIIFHKNVMLNRIAILLANTCYLVLLMYFKYLYF